jgi:hypothetical protein
MKRVAALACCLLMVAACPGPKSVAPESCRESAPPDECKSPPTQLGGHQGPFLEGNGLERQRFAVPGGAFPPAPGTTLQAIGACGNDNHPTLKVIACSPIPGIDGNAVFGCQVDVVSSPAVVARRPLATGFCVTPRLEAPSTPQDPDPTHHRGVTVVHGSWDASGAWQDAPGVVTLSCDANSNAPGVQQFEGADGAITDCVREWRLDPATLHDAFLACIRMARADYCGDGHPHTLGGTEVGVATPRDPMKISECQDGRCFEASWSKNGAVCIARTRWEGPGMAFESCQSQFTSAGAMSCRGDPAQGIVFSRSKHNVCSQLLGGPCASDADPVCVKP